METKFNDVYGLAPLCEQGASLEEVLDAIAEKDGNPSYYDEGCIYIIDNYIPLKKLGLSFHTNDLYSIILNHTFLFDNRHSKEAGDVLVGLTKILRIEGLNTWYIDSDGNGALYWNFSKKWLSDACSRFVFLIAKRLKEINADIEMVDVRTFIRGPVSKTLFVKGIMQKLFDFTPFSEKVAIVRYLLDNGVKSEWLVEEMDESDPAFLLAPDGVDGKEWLDHAGDINLFVDDLIWKTFIFGAYYEFVLQNLSELEERGFDAKTFFCRLFNMNDEGCDRFGYCYAVQRLEYIIRYYPLLKGYGANLETIVSDAMKYDKCAVKQNLKGLLELGVKVDIIELNS